MAALARAHIPGPLLASARELASSWRCRSRVWPRLQIPWRAGHAALCKHTTYSDASVSSPIAPEFPL
eukprot:14650641-Alexandrium_andersonii.AAC.1